MIPRILEPEIMDTAEESAEYDAMDHGEVNRRFVADFLEAWPNAESPILDVGTGTALIPIELCRVHPEMTVIAQDASAEMLKLAQHNVDEAGFAQRITLQLSNARQLPIEAGSVGAVISNSIIHHVSEPETVFAELIRIGKVGTVYFVRDLLRPASDAELKQLVQTYAGDATPRQQQLFAESLHAALTLDEVQELVAQYGFNREMVQVTSDRHWTWSALGLVASSA